MNGNELQKRYKNNYQVIGKLLYPLDVSSRHEIERVITISQEGNKHRHHKG